MNVSSPSRTHRALIHAVTVLVALVLVCRPVYAQNVCNTTASSVNPATLEPGIGGTGSPVSGTLRAWWQALTKGTVRAGSADSASQHVVASRPGIGGTGISSDNGGIGGTGIVGVITGFASICVNGVEVHYDASTPVFSDGRAAMARELAVGQVVAVRASGAGAQVAARNIAVLHAVVGPVSRVDLTTGQLELLGQTVRADDPGDLSNLKSGDWVQVSGYRLSSGEVAASRIEPIAARAQAQITGQIGRVDASGFMLYGARIRLDKLSLPSGAVPGTEVAVRGSWDGISLIARGIEIDPTRHGVGRVDNVVLEGYVHALRGSELSLGNNVMTLAPNVQISGSSGSPLAVDQRVQVSGRVGADQRITVDRVDVRGEGSGSGGTRSGKGISSGRSGSSGSSGGGMGGGSSGGGMGGGSSGGG
uniref:DUF5666 domain-containing protein n=1 Tax=Polaromonas sp. UBA4122 TaxID=1947074 RepID=UPI0025F4BB01